MKSASLVLSVCTLLSATHGIAQSCDLVLAHTLQHAAPSDFQHFGGSAALGGDILVISDSTTSSGWISTPVYIYRSMGDSWVLDDTIVREIKFGERGFGAAMAVHNGDVIISYTEESDPLTGEDTGSLYVYRDGPQGWEAVQRIVASDGAPDDRFGGYIEMLGDTMAVYAFSGTTNGQTGGAIYLFDHNGTEWIETEKIEPTIPAPYSYSAGAIARANGSLFVADSFSNNAQGISTGVVHELRRAGNVWAYHTTHEPFGTSDNSFFGVSVATSGNLLFVSDPGDNANGFFAGAIYVYQFDGNEWVFSEKLRPADGMIHGAFGAKRIAADENNLFVSGNTLLTSDTPSIYHFQITAAGLEERNKILTPSQSRSRFADAFTIQEQTLLAPDDTGPDTATQQGVVYLYDIHCDTTCPADTNNDGSLTPTDFNAWINAFNNNLPECDQNGDGSCTPTDFNAWIANYNAGC